MDASVQQFCRKNRISSELISQSNFSTAVQPNEYVLIRTQRAEGTGSLVMYQYKFTKSDLTDAQKLVKATDMEDLPASLGQFTQTSIMQ